MRTAPVDRRSLVDLTLAGGTGSRALGDDVHRVPFEEFSRGTNLNAALALLRGDSVLLSSERQLATVLTANFGP